MSYLVCDLGSYSIKYSWTKVSRKKITFEIIEEIIYPEEIDTSNYIERLNFLVTYLKEKKLDDIKTCLNIPDHLITSRYLTLPVTQKKKALLMLPFQLDEQLPLPIDKQHIASFIQVNTSNTSTISQIIGKDKLRSIFKIFDKLDFFPTNFSSNLLYLNTSLDKIPSNGAIIDLGHQYTHLYAMKNSRLIADETFHFGGKNISEMISQVYNIDQGETAIFKHRHSFYLTKLQYDEADQDQKDFALLMEKVTQHLLTEINRWRLSVRVNHGISIDQIYLTGGTSKIKNICEYLQEKIGVKFSILTYPNDQKINFNILNISNSLVSKIKASTFLTGDFASKNSDELPLRNLGYIFSRGMMFALIMLFFLLADTLFILKPADKKISIKLSKLIKKTSLGITRKDKRILKRFPKKFYAKLLKQQLKITRKINKISQANHFYPMTALNTLGATLSVDQQVTLEKFVSDGISIKTQWSAPQAEDLKKLEKQFRQLKFKSTKTSINYKNKNIEFKYRF